MEYLGPAVWIQKKVVWFGSMSSLLSRLPWSPDAVGFFRSPLRLESNVVQATCLRREQGFCDTAYIEENIQTKKDK